MAERMKQQREEEEMMRMREEYLTYQHEGEMERLEKCLNINVFGEGDGHDYLHLPAHKRPKRYLPKDHPSRSRLTQQEAVDLVSRLLRQGTV